MLEVGLRVVRGPDWKWGDQDGGEGYAGTVVEIGKPPSTSNSASSPNPVDKTPDKTVIVHWDHGSRSNYRIGYQDAYDLLVFDNAATGVKHSNIICDGCKRRGISGIRWKCVQCFDFDLCTQCYMADIHDLNHPFLRFQTADAVGVQMSPREGCTKIPLKGIFIGAKVKRGPDWEWGNQDGGRGNSGRVMDIRGWDNESSRSVATVTWSPGNTNVYRLGYKGCVDLCFVEESNAGTYYKEHLPLLGQPVQTTPSEECTASNSVPSPRHTTVNVGDKVKVSIDVDTLKEMQTGHGGWNPRMAEYIGKIGKVHRVTDKGDIRVQYEGCNNRWTFHPGALTKVANKDTFALGDIVRVKTDLTAVKHYQRGHGEWIDIMKSALGKVGKVIKIYPDGDMRVALDGHTWTFNPLSVILVPRGSEIKADINLGGSSSASEVIDSEVEKLLREAARGEADVNTVHEFLRKHPGKVDARAGGPGGGKKTCLQIASHQGQRELCILLLDAGASVHAVDEDGDTPLHYAAFGNQPEIMDLLLSRGASINAVNNGKCSALHIAVNKQHVACVRMLLRHGCDVNLQDSYGDTALHDAIGKEALEIVDALCSCEQVDFTLRNKRGFNVLHHAALKGNAHATKRLVSRARHLVDVKKDDGFAALHLAALNGHREVAAVLLSQAGGRAEVDLRNNRRQTPLHLATSQAHWSLVQLLVSHNANVGAKDQDGDTVLHLAIAKSRHLPTSVSMPENNRDSPKIYAIWQKLSREGAKSDLALSCYLVSVDKSGTLLEQAQNAKGITPLGQLQSDPDFFTIAELLRSYKYQWRSQNNQSDDETESTGTGANSEVERENVETLVARSQESKKNASGSVENTECRRCSAISINDREDGRIVSGSSVPINGCVHCGCTSERSKISQGDRQVVSEGTKQLENAKVKSESLENEEKAERKNTEKDKDLERLRYLETRVADLEEANMCSICMERRRNVVFLCGHGACDHCATPLKTCHMCRQTITKKINLY